MTAQAAFEHRPAPAAHPNEFDLKRIERALQARVRYRYVNPSVEAVAGGYRIEAPCCSRNIDPEGGIIDIALMLYDADTRAWRLYYKNHARAAWELANTHARLHDLLTQVNEDPDRQFWQ